MSFSFPERETTRPVWLITLADLALLLVGFFVLLQANPNKGAVAASLRAGFDAPAPPMPVAAAAVRFATGSAAPEGSSEAVIAWARDAARDPRVSLTVTGSSDGSAADVDPATDSGEVLALDRARALAAALAAAQVGSGRLLLTTARRDRSATVTAGFSGLKP